MKWKLGIAIALIVGLPLGALKILPLAEIGAILDWIKLTARDLVISVLNSLVCTDEIDAAIYSENPTAFAIINLHFTFLPIDLHPPSDYVLGHPIALELNHRGRN